jgi:hypothetical protein
VIRRSHDRWRCPKCRYTCLFPPTLSGKPQFWCPLCSIGGEDVAMQRVPPQIKPPSPGQPVRPRS